jgi:hypothetical protein
MPAVILNRLMESRRSCDKSLEHPGSEKLAIGCDRVEKSG